MYNMSQILYEAPSFQLMKSRKIIMNSYSVNMSGVFFHRIKTRTYIKYFRHSSLQINVLNVPLRLQSCTVNNEQDILDQPFV